MPMLTLAALALAGGRERIDLNRDWQFARLPAAPSAWAFPDAVPTSAWRVISVDSEETAKEDGRAANAIDGRVETIWHTEWSQRQAPFPHEIRIDLGSRVETIGLRLLPRQTGPQNGHPKHVELYLSRDGKTWGAPIVSSPVPDTNGRFECRFPAVTGRWMRLIFSEGQRSEPYLALSEIGLIRNLDTKARKEWSSQYNVSMVDLGEERFDLRGTHLERIKARELDSIRDWSKAVLPHSPWIRPLGSSKIWQGVTYYRRRLDFAHVSAHGRYVLTLEGAMQASDLWLNGVHLASRRGGYLPMIVDLTGKLKRHNQVLVRVDNSDNPLIPPGKPQQELDFMYGCGLYRNAYLTVTGPVYVTHPLLESGRYGGGVYVTFPLVERDRAVLGVRTHVRNGSQATINVKLRQRLFNANGRMVSETNSPIFVKSGQDDAIVQRLQVGRPNLWSPDSPSLYRLETSILAGSSVVDRVFTRLGIRSIEVSRKGGFLLNGQPIRLIGTNRHQDYPWIGIALSDRAQIRDAILIKRSGHNIVRLSHYPQSPAFMDACDELGIMTIPCIPGWQFYNKDPRFRDRVIRDIRELIRRDRNHPSAVFWETSLNETYPPNDVAVGWVEAARSESLDGRILTAGDGQVGSPWDVVYNQWRDGDMSRPQSAVPAKPGYIREYGDYEFGGALSSSRVRIAEGPEKLLQEAWNHVWSLNRYRPQYPWTMGAGTWVMFDHNVPWDFRISACGLADLFRRPKPSFWFFSSQESKTPIAKLGQPWETGDAKRRVVVFTNCDSVELRLNGRSITRSTPRRGHATAYRNASPFDGTNTANLAHPPVVFDAVPFRPGKLEAIGYIKGRPVASDRAVTPGQPARLKVWIDDFGVSQAADGADSVFVRAAVVDKPGNVLTKATGKVRFTVTGLGSIAGEPFVPLEMGVASCLVKAGVKPGAIHVHAQLGELAGQATWTTIRPLKRDSQSP